MFVEEALENGAAIIHHARVTNVILEGNKAVGVAYTKGLRNTAATENIAVRPGSPVILQQRPRRAGYDFFFDPHHRLRRGERYSGAGK